MTPPGLPESVRFTVDTAILHAARSRVRTLPGAGRQEPLADGPDLRA
jgi:hypothetical protein